MAYGVAAAFSADADGTVRLPFDLRTGRLIDDVWARWLAWAPVRMVPDHADALRSLRAIYLGGSTRDDIENALRVWVCRAMPSPPRRSSTSAAATCRP